MSGHDGTSLRTYPVVCCQAPHHQFQCRLGYLGPGASSTTRSGPPRVAHFAIHASLVSSASRCHRGPGQGLVWNRHECHCQCLQTQERQEQQKQEQCKRYLQRTGSPTSCPTSDGVVGASIGTVPTRLGSQERQESRNTSRGTRCHSLQHGHGMLGQNQPSGCLQESSTHVGTANRTLSAIAARTRRFGHSTSYPGQGASGCLRIYLRDCQLCIRVLPSTRASCQGLSNRLANLCRNARSTRGSQSCHLRQSPQSLHPSNIRQDGATIESPRNSGFGC